MKSIFSTELSWLVQACVVIIITTIIIMCIFSAGKRVYEKKSVYGNICPFYVHTEYNQNTVDFPLYALIHWIFRFILRFSFIRALFIWFVHFFFFLPFFDFNSSFSQHSTMLSIYSGFYATSFLRWYTHTHIDICMSQIFSIYYSVSEFNSILSLKRKKKVCFEEFIRK